MTPRLLRTPRRLRRREGTSRNHLMRGWSRRARSYRGRGSRRPCRPQACRGPSRAVSSLARPPDRCREPRRKRLAWHRPRSPCRDPHRASSKRARTHRSGRSREYKRRRLARRLRPSPRRRDRSRAWNKRARTRRTARNRCGRPSSRARGRRRRCRALSRRSPFSRESKQRGRRRRHGRAKNGRASTRASVADRPRSDRTGARGWPPAELLGCCRRSPSSGRSESSKWSPSAQTRWLKHPAARRPANGRTHSDTYGTAADHLFHSRSLSCMARSPGYEWREHRAKAPTRL